MTNPYVTLALGLTPRMVRRLLDNLPTTVYDVHTAPDRFSLREAIAHLADWEAIHLSRIQAAVLHPGSPMPDIDESQVAIDGKYADRDPHVEAARFISERPTLLAFLSSLTAADWSKTFVHSVKGELTVEEYTSAILGHDVYHLDHLLEYLPIQ